MLSDKELSELAKQIIKAEKIIQDNKNQEAVKMAQQFIEKTTESLTLKDMLKLDDLIIKSLL